MLNAITLIIFSNDEYLNLRKLNLDYVDDEKLKRVQLDKKLKDKKNPRTNCSWIFYYFEIISIT